MQWYLEHPEATDEELLDELMERIKGPDFPTGALIVGRRGIEDAYRTGRGSITMRAVVEVEEDNRGRTRWSSPSCRTRSTPTTSRRRSPSWSTTARSRASPTSATSPAAVPAAAGHRAQRDAVAKVVLNNLYKHTQLQDTFGANMLALVDGVPRTLSLDAFVRHWVDHQIEVIVRRTRYRLRKAEERAHILRGLLKALDAIDEVIALIRRSATVEDARAGLMRCSRSTSSRRGRSSTCSCAGSRPSSGRRSPTSTTS